MAGVYYILCLHNDKIYVGESERIRKRMGEHRLMLRSRKHTSESLQMDWNTYGESAFEFGILTYHPYSSDCGDELSKLESIFIHAYQSSDPNLGYNIRNIQKARQQHDLHPHLPQSR